jgi:hypothetical protein
MYNAPLLPDPGVLAEADAFLASPAGQDWLGNLADNFPHMRYWRDRSDCWRLSRLNALAARIIDAHYDGQDVEEAMEAEFPPAEFWPTWQHEVAPAVRTLLHDAGVRDDDEEILDAIRSGWEDIAADRDDSCVGDLFASYDRCELLFRFSPHRWLDDSLLHSRRPWPQFAELAVTQNLQFALGNLGYTISQYRKASGNTHKADQPLTRHGRRRRPPIVNWEKIEELVDNACSTSFLVCLYAIVPIPTLIDLDLTKPVTFEKCWVASMDPINGTFHDVPAAGSVTVMPADGRFLAGGHLRWSPDDICGLHTPHYHASVRN